MFNAGDLENYDRGSTIRHEPLIEEILIISFESVVYTNRGFRLEFVPS